MKQISVSTATLMVGSLVFLLACSTPSTNDGTTTQQADESLRERLTLEWVTDTIDRSPDDWLAAIQEVSDDSQCFGSEDGSSCRLDVRVIEYLGGPRDRPAEMREGWEYLNVEAQLPDQWRHRRIGRKRLVLSTPVGDEANVHGNWIFVLDPTAEDVEKLRALLEEAGAA